MGAFRTFWQAGRDLFDELFGLMFANLLWLLISMPLLGLAFFLFAAGSPLAAGVVALLSVLLFAPANAGLTLIAQRVVEGRTFEWRLFFEGFREPRVLSWQIYGLWMIGLLLILVNLGFYGQLANGIGAFLTVLFLYILVIWFSLLIYLGPLSIIQTDRRVRTVWRNALILALSRPFFTLLTTFLMGIIATLSIWIPLLLILLTAAFFAVWGFRATTNVIAEAEERRRALEEKRAAAAPSGAPPAQEKGRGGQVRPRD
ncbi:MAG: hypothetical protein DIU80_004870 [Chloroflexota bacterium]|nr:MAG: hypothetical protein DIU80_21830 [Chloroflexota bacterium]